MKVFASEELHPRGSELLTSQVEAVYPAGRESIDSLVRDVDGIVVRLFPVTRELIDKAAKLKVIGRHGSGVDNVDLDFATRRRIPVSTPRMPMLSP